MGVRAYSNYWNALSNIATNCEQRSAEMVVLGQVFSLLKMFPKGADRGLYAGKGIMHGHTVTFSNKK